MPDSTRGLLIKKAESVEGHFAAAYEALNYMFEKYYPDYPKFYEPLQTLITAVCQGVEMLRTIKEEM